MDLVCHVILRDHKVLRFYGWEFFKVSHHIANFEAARSQDARTMLFYRQELLKVSYTCAKFVGHMLSGSGDIMVLHCHVISKDHVIKGSCNFMSKSPLKVSHHPAKWLSALWKLRHDGSSLSYELKRPLDEKAM